MLAPCIESSSKNYRHVFGVADGHGQFGHHVSAFIKEHLVYLTKQLLERFIDDESLPKEVLYEDGKVHLHEQYRDFLESAFLNCDATMDEHLPKSLQVDLKLSGSTVCLVLIDGSTIHCANAGDSRAIKVSLINDKVLIK